MGYGDSIMATGRARVLHEALGLKVAIGDGAAVRWCEVYENNPRLASAADVAAGQPVTWLVDHPGNRPYLDYEAMLRSVGAGEATGWQRRRALRRCRARLFRDAFAPVAGELWLTEAERAWPAELFATARKPVVVVNPDVKRRASPNKDWGLDNWRRLAALLSPRFALVRLGPTPSLPKIPGIAQVMTPSFRLGCAVLARAAAYVGHEGGLHHAAAALGVPGVVIFGGFIAPRITGYGVHVNLWGGGAETPCGRLDACPHCAQAMRAIAPETVAAALDVAMGQVNRTGATGHE